ncbi:recombinase family protein [Micromonospora sp. CPCC 205371]|nr:recombinase family protein [Micromonospora sp. CPCC 205371]
MADIDAAQGRDGRRPVIDVYARISRLWTGEMIKVDDQIELCEEKIEARGARVGRVFKDPSLSAWKPNVVRPDWEQMMRRVESGDSDGVIVYDVTRFSRKIIEGERLVEAAANGARVWSLAGEYDLTTADGRRHFREAMVAAAGESDKISERVKRGKVRRARKGKVSGGARGYGLPGYEPKPEGWEKGDPLNPVPAEVVEAERAIVRECYRRLLAGETVSAVVRDLNARKVPSPRGLRWTRGHLPRLLMRPAMAGLLSHNGEVVGELAGVEAVVSREEWERLCSIFAARKRGRPAGRVHLLSGLMFCGTCGAPMRGHPRKSSTPYADGSPRREYRCRSVDGNENGCRGVFIDAKVAEDAVEEAVKQRLGDPRNVARLAKRAATTQAERARIEGEISRLNEQADTLAEKTALWGAARVDKAMGPILRRIDALTKELAGLDAPDTVSAASRDAVREWDQAKERGDIEELRAMVKRAFPRLTITPRQMNQDHRPERFDWDGKTLARNGRKTAPPVAA